MIKFNMYKPGFEKKLKDSARIIIKIAGGIGTAKWSKANKVFYTWGIVVEPKYIEEWSLSIGQKLSDILEKEESKDLTPKQVAAKKKFDIKLAEVFGLIFKFKIEQLIFDKEKEKIRIQTRKLIDSTGSCYFINKFFDNYIEGGFDEIFTTDSSKINASDVTFSVKDYYKWLEDEEDC